MKAALYDHYGGPDIVRVGDVPKPQPKDHELLIEVRATTVTSGDARIRALNMPKGFGLLSRLVFGIGSPRNPILGVELSGVVVEVGKRVTRFKVGDAVFAMSGMGMRCHAEFRALPETGAIAKAPANLSFEEAAAMSFGGTTALSFFRRGKLKPGERLLINGASGAVGTAALQLAKNVGAHVTAVCSTANIELVRSLGADALIDYKREDFAVTGARYDVIMDTVGTAPYSRSKQALNDKGRLLLVLAGLPQILAAPWQNLTTSHTVIAGPATERAEDLRELATLAEQGRYKPVIDEVFPLEQVTKAHARVDSARKRGNVVLVMNSGTL